MKIRFYNAKILTMQSEDIITGELHTDGDKITFAGSENIPQGSFDREIDLTGKLIIPGFKNAHTHTAMTFLRSLRTISHLTTGSMSRFSRTRRSSPRRRCTFSLSLATWSTLRAE